MPAPAAYQLALRAQPVFELIGLILVKVDDMGALGDFVLIGLARALGSPRWWPVGRDARGGLGGHPVRSAARLRSPMSRS
jgi:hypothetical protein